MNSFTPGAEYSETQYSRSEYLALRIKQQPISLSARIAMLCLCLPVVLPWVAPANAAEPTVQPIAATTSTAAAAAPTADAVQEAFVRVADRIKPSVVTIYSERVPKAAAKA